MSEVSEVSEAEWEVWRNFLRMRTQLDRVLEKQLQQDAGISSPDYAVLLTLFEAEGKQLRARELGELLLWEKSRVSHQVSRMEKRGLVERTQCDTDARGTWIGLTAAGKRATLKAMRNHAATIRRAFFDVLSPEELDALRTAAPRVLHVIEPPDCDELDNVTELTA